MWINDMFSSQYLIELLRSHHFPVIQGWSHHCHQSTGEDEQVTFNAVHNGATIFRGNEKRDHCFILLILSFVFYVWYIICVDFFRFLFISSCFWFILLLISANDIRIKCLVILIYAHWLYWLIATSCMRNNYLRLIWQLEN